MMGACTKHITMLEDPKGAGLGHKFCQPGSKVTVSVSPLTNCTCFHASFEHSLPFFLRLRNASYKYPPWKVKEKIHISQCINLKHVKGIQGTCYCCYIIIYIFTFAVLCTEPRALLMAGKSSEKLILQKRQRIFIPPQLWLTESSCSKHDVKKDSEDLSRSARRRSETEKHWV